MSAIVYTLRNERKKVDSTIPLPANIETAQLLKTVYFPLFTLKIHTISGYKFRIPVSSCLLAAPHVSSLPTHPASPHICVQNQQVTIFHRCRVLYLCTVQRLLKTYRFAWTLLDSTLVVGTQNISTEWRRIKHQTLTPHAWFQPGSPFTISRYKHTMIHAFPVTPTWRVLRLQMENMTSVCGVQLRAYRIRSRGKPIRGVHSAWWLGVWQLTTVNTMLWNVIESLECGQFISNDVSNGKWASGPYCYFNGQLVKDTGILSFSFWGTHGTEALCPKDSFVPLGHQNCIPRLLRVVLPTWMLHILLLSALTYWFMEDLSRHNQLYATGRTALACLCAVRQGCCTLRRGIELGGNEVRSAPSKCCFIIKQFLKHTHKTWFPVHHLSLLNLFKNLRSTDKVCRI